MSVNDHFYSVESIYSSQNKSNVLIFRKYCQESRDYEINFFFQMSNNNWVCRTQKDIHLAY